MALDALVVHDENQQAIIDAFEGEVTAPVVDIVRRASAIRPPALVREAYWELVTDGVLVLSASNHVRLNG